ncbi:MAG: phosphatidylglycerol lysyltransferase domain-containing protein [Myxococcota bacterium]
MTPVAADDPRLSVLALLRRHGWNTTSFQVLEPGYRYWFGDDACVAYVETGGAWVAAGAPVCERSRLGAVAAEFVAAARDAGRRAVFFGVEAPFVEGGGMPAFKIGEQPSWDPGRWQDGVARSRSLREQLRRARAKGVVVRRVDAAELAAGSPLRVAVDDLVRRWLASRAMAPMGFLVDIEPYRFADERRYVAAEVDGRLVGFLAAVPIYGRAGWLVEDLLRAPLAPNGTTELCIDFAMRAFAAEGATFATLGMVPLAGVDGWLRWIRERARTLYDFGGLDAFRQKLLPHARDAIWLAHPPEVGRTAALRYVLTAFARGSLLRFGGQTLLRGGPRTLGLLAALLVPWTVMLALAPGWFPSTAVHVAWVAFDLVLATGLFVLAGRYRRRLGLAVAGMTTLDVVLTALQAFAWNAPRVSGVGEALVLGIGLLAPCAGAAIAWGAALRHAHLSRDG